MKNNPALRALDLERRKRIFNYILKYPGLHLQDLIRRLNLSNGTVRYHLKYLEKRGLITTRANDGYVRIYVSNNIGEKQKIMIHLLRQDTPRNTRL